MEILPLNRERIQDANPRIPGNDGCVALLDANAQVARIRRALCPRFYAMAAPAHVEGAAP